MKCTVTTDILIDWLREELSPAQAKELRLHVDSCDGCRKESTLLRTTWNASHALSVDISADFAQILGQKLAHCNPAPVATASFEGLLIDKALGELPGNALASVHDRIDANPANAKLNAQIRDTLKSAQMLDRIEPSPDFVGRVMSAVHAAAAEEKTAADNRLDCDDARPLLVDFAFRELEVPLMNGMEEHLGRCSDCSDEFEEIVRAIQIARATGNVAPTRVFPRKVATRISQLLDLEKKRYAGPPVKARILSFFRYHYKRLPTYAASVAIHAAMLLITLALTQNQRVLTRLTQSMPIAETVRHSGVVGPMTLTDRPEIITVAMQNAAKQLWNSSAGPLMDFDDNGGYDGDAPTFLSTNRDPQDTREHVGRRPITRDALIISADGRNEKFSENQPSRTDELPRLLQGRIEARTRRNVLCEIDGYDHARRKGMIWLAQSQLPDGSWPVDDNQFGGLTSHKPGISALAILAFLGQGDAHNSDGLFSRHVSLGIRYLLSQQDERGLIGAAANPQSYMYSHAIATMALLEDYALSRDEALLREPVSRAVRALLSAQSKNGSWGYTTPADALTPNGDSSITVWQWTALHLAGSVKIDGVSQTQIDSAKTRAMEFLNSLLDAQGRLHYDKNKSGTYGLRATTAAHLFTRAMATPGKLADSLSRTQTDFLLKNIPKWIEHPESMVPRAAKDFSNDMYFNYYATLALHRIGGKSWESWERDMMELLIRRQENAGPFAGSWDHRNDKFGVGAGRVYTTSLALLTLEVYFRYR